MGVLLGRRAVVAGAGVGGLAAAGALAGYFEQVDVLERDSLTASASSRPGTPQDRHPHGLLAGGLRALDRIFPGFANDLAASGAVPIRVAQDFQFERPDVGVLPARDFGLTALGASRPLIEHVLRLRVAAIANVVLRPGCRITGILPATVDAGARGVRFDAGSGRTETLEADLVVDASGRGMLTLALFDSLGLEPPPMTEVGVDLRYATAVIGFPAGASPGKKVVLTLPDPPASASDAVLLPVENDRWMTLIASRGAGARPESWDEFLEALGRLRTQTIYNMLRHAEPPGSIRHYGFPASRWRHFERSPLLPRGVLPVADALCRFNPVYGQGMSAAAQQACLLKAAAERAAAQPDPLAALQAGFMSEVASLLQTPWGMSTSADLAFPETRGERPEDFAEAQQFEAALFRAVVADPVVHRAMMEVGQLLRPFSHLQEPDILARIEAASVKFPA